MKGTGVKLTVFTLFTIAITFWLAAIIGNISPLADTYRIDATFTDATGVLVGDPVKVAGVTVGKVIGFKVVKGQAIISMQVDGEVDIPENVQVDMVYRNLLGQRMIDLKRPEPASDEYLEDGDVVPVEQTRPALDITLVFNNLRPLINSTNPEEINAVARAVLRVFEGREEDLAGILGNVGELTKTLASRDQRLARLVTDFDALTKVLNSESASIKKGLSEFTAFIESLADVTPTIERVVTQLDEASADFGGLIQRNRSNLDQELADLNTLLTIVNDNLRPLETVAQNLKEVLLATARTQSYGRWWTLYVVNLCVEGVPEAAEGLECQR